MPTFVIPNGQTKTIGIRGKKGTKPGALLAGDVPSWTPLDASKVSLVVASDGLSAAVTSLDSACSSNIRVIAKNSSGISLIETSLQIDSPMEPADSLEYFEIP